jgi:hypothetical protein
MWTLTALLKAAKGLENQSVCVHALLRPIQSPTGLRMTLYEFAPLRGEPGTSRSRAGLLDWDTDLGISESAYHPESYDLLDGASGACPAGTERDLTFEVEVRGVLKYKKRLVAHVLELVPPPLASGKAHVPAYDMEMVVLQFLTAKAHCGPLR